MNRPAILIPAAGASSRMRGRDKLLEPVAGEPLLRRQARIALATGVAVAVALPPDNAPRAACLDGLAATRLVVADAALGMAGSLRAGTRWADDLAAPGLMVLLADMPEIETTDLTLLIGHFARHPDRILRATTDTGTPGHPVIFPRRLFRDLAQVQGDSGGRDILAQETAHLIPLPGHRAITDLDTPEDWARWRQAQ